MSIPFPNAPPTATNIFGPRIDMDPATITRIARERQHNTAKQQLKRAIEANDMETVRRLVEEDPEVILNVDDHAPTEHWQHAFEFAQSTLRYSSVSQEMIQYLRNNTPNNYKELRNRPIWERQLSVFNHTRTAQDAVNVFM